VRARSRLCPTQLAAPRGGRGSSCRRLPGSVERVGGRGSCGVLYDVRPAGTRQVEVRRRLDYGDRLIHVLPDLRTVVHKSAAQWPCPSDRVRVSVTALSEPDHLREVLRAVATTLTFNGVLLWRPLRDCAPEWFRPPRNRNRGASTRAAFSN
jgi:hypothetical protein